MLAISLQSGSNGNCIYVEAGANGRTVRLLFDAGISGKQARMRLAETNRDIRDVDAVIISHDHGDHASGMGIYHRLFELPIYATQQTYIAAEGRHNLGKISDVRFFTAGDCLEFDGGVSVETVPTPHDAADGAAFIIDDGSRRLGIFTDLGHVFDGLGDLIGTLDAVLLESNYDPAMLANGPYPAFLKQRISGSGGHISNAEAAELLRTCGRSKLQWAALAHLSHENNDPEVALAVHREILGPDLPIHVASRYAASEVLEV